MRNHKEMFEALLAGETLINSENGRLIKLMDGNLYATRAGNPDGLVLLKNVIGGMYDPEVFHILPKTININGFEVPEPVRTKIEVGTNYYVPMPIHYKYYNYIWNNDEEDNEFLHRGLVHLTQEAAIKHAEALLSFTTLEK